MQAYDYCCNSRSVENFLYFFVEECGKNCYNNIVLIYLPSVNTSKLMSIIYILRQEKYIYSGILNTGILFFGRKNGKFSKK